VEQMKGCRPCNISTDAVDIWMELLGEDEQVREVERHHESHHEPRSRADNNEVVFDHVIDDVRYQTRLLCIRTIIQRWTAEPLITREARNRELGPRRRNKPRQLVVCDIERS